MVNELLPILFPVDTNPSIRPRRYDPVDTNPSTRIIDSSNERTAIATMP